MISLICIWQRAWTMPRKVFYILYHYVFIVIYCDNFDIIMINWSSSSRSLSHLNVSWVEPGPPHHILQASVSHPTIVGPSPSSLWWLSQWRWWCWWRWWWWWWWRWWMVMLQQTSQMCWKPPGKLHALPLSASAPVSEFFLLLSSDCLQSDNYRDNLCMIALSKDQLTILVHFLLVPWMTHINLSASEHPDI